MVHNGTLTVTPMPTYSIATPNPAAITNAEKPRFFAKHGFSSKSNGAPNWSTVSYCAECVCINR
jgi:hypothetical protein